MRNAFSLFILSVCIAACAEPLVNDRLAPPHKDQKGPQISAVFRNSTHFPVYRKGETILLNCHVKNGTLKENDVLVWKLLDFKWNLLKSGEIAVTPEMMRKAINLEFKPRKFGCYFVELSMKKSGITIPWEGSRPKGYVTFGILPDVKPLPLASPEDSRFGLDGPGTYISDDDKFFPLTTLLGVHWAKQACYPWLSDPKRNQFQVTSKEQFEQFWKIPFEKSPFKDLRSIGKNKFSILNCMHGIPHHLANIPDAMKGRKIKLLEFAYLYNDPEYYRELMKRYIQTARNFRESKFNYMRRGYYLIHWEPDWHWKGNTEEFLQMYRDFSVSLREADPGAVLLGINDAVVARSVPRMRELFQKGLGKYIQGVAVHLYFLPITSLPEDKNLHGNCREMRQLADRYLGKDAPLMNTEWGTSVVNTLLVDHTMLMNHMYRFIRGHLIALGEGFTSTCFFYGSDYDFVNYPEHGEHGYGLTFNLSRNNFGTLSAQPKPTYMAAAALTRLLEGTKTLGRLDHLEPQTFAYTFRRNNENLIAVWNPYRKRTVDLPTGKEQVTVCDIMGNSEQVKTKNGILTLQIDEYPRYVLGISDSALPTAPRTRNSRFSKTHGRLMTGASLSGLLRDGTVQKHPPVFRLYQENCERLSIQNGRLPERLSAGIKRLDICDTQGNSLESMLLDVVSPVRISGIADIPGKSGKLFAGVSLSNDSDRDVRTSVRIAYGRQKTSAKPVSLRGKESRMILFDVSRLYQGRPLADLLATAFSDAGTDHTFIRESWGAFTASRLTPKIDGNLNEWKRSNFSSLLGKDMQSRPYRWKGEADFSIRYQVAADEQGCALALEVTDDKDYFKTDLKKPWLADSIMFAVGLKSNHRGAWEKVRFFSVGRDEKGRTAVHSMIGLPPNQELYRIDEKTLNAVVKRDEANRKTVYEIRIPWETVGGKTKEFGLGISVLDADSEKDVLKDTHREINIMGGIPFFMSSALMSTVFVPEMQCENPVQK